MVWYSLADLQRIIPVYVCVLWETCTYQPLWIASHYAYALITRELLLVCTWPWPKFSFMEFFRVITNIRFNNVWMHDHPRDQHEHTFHANRKQKHITNLLVERRLKFGIRNQIWIWKWIEHWTWVPIFYFMAKAHVITFWNYKLKCQKIGGRLTEH